MTPACVSRALAAAGRPDDREEARVAKALDHPRDVAFTSEEVSGVFLVERLETPVRAHIRQGFPQQRRCRAAERPKEVLRPLRDAAAQVRPRVAPRNASSGSSGSGPPGRSAATIRNALSRWAIT